MTEDKDSIPTDNAIKKLPELERKAFNDIRRLVGNQKWWVKGLATIPLLNSVDDFRYYHPGFTISTSHIDGLSLSGENLPELYRKINHFSYLQHLDLSHNQLQTLPDQISKLKQLQYLDLSSNKFHTLPPVITELSQLHTLVLSHNFIFII